jgi:LemA protein
MEIIALVLLAVLLLFFWVLHTYNQMIKARNQQEEAWSGVDVQLRKRHHLVPALVEIVRGYSYHEKTLFTDITTARSDALSSHRTDPAEQALTSGLRALFALVENYPDLKASENFQQLSSQLVEIENQLQYARRYYNGSTRDFRNLTQTFPKNIIAKAFSFQPAQFFEVECATERLSPKVTL